MSTSPSDSPHAPADAEPAGPDLDAWLVRLEKNHPVEIELGLDRIAEVARRMALRPPAAKVVTVAGTNGKGSCVRTLEQLLLTAGLRVGTYTSPHLVRYNERIRIQGIEVDDAALCRAFALIDGARGDVSLTYFEVGTLAALLLLAEADLDVAVLEVGLGGRFDAVNLIAADIAVITAIAIDHSHWLGTTREQIALEKAGIARPGAEVVVADEQPPQPLIDYLDELDCHTLYLGRDFSYRREPGALSVALNRAGDSPRGSSQLGSSPLSSSPLSSSPLLVAGLPLPALPLPSVVAALQVAALLGLPLEPEFLAPLCATLALPGRFQRVDYRGRRVILDVAHNPAAASYLCERLQAEGESQIAVVAAIMADKDAEGFVTALQPVAGHWYLGALLGAPRALPAEQLSGVVYTCGQRGSCWGDIGEAFAAAIDATPASSLVVVCGSFLTVAAIIEFMGV